MAASYWVNTVSLEHVELGVEGGFTQAEHGSDTKLRKLRRGDGLVFYSPRTAMRSGRPLRQFTALGTIADDEPYRVKVRPDFVPWRLKVDFEQAHPAEAGELLEQLSFITDVRQWGVPFRQGLFEIGADDFAVIRSAMTS
ncbi:MAG: hypothetical protein JWN22_3258 [Nocardioides sp.]|jgi:hypothetical protein|nr:hypothetical protein [Nocardioides sp.]